MKFIAYKGTDVGTATAEEVTINSAVDWRRVLAETAKGTPAEHLCSGDTFALTFQHFLKKDFSLNPEWNDLYIVRCATTILGYCDQLPTKLTHSGTIV